MSIFMDHLQQLMDERGLTDKEFREQCGGISKNNITNWRNGMKPQASTSHRIADFFGVSHDWLIGISEIKARLLDELSSDNEPIDKQIAELIRYFRECDARGQLRIAQVALNEWERTQNARSEAT